MIIVHVDNPFVDDINLSHARSKRRVVTQGEPQMLNGQMVQVIAMKEYTPVLFSRVAQHRDLLDDLTPEGSKLFIHIALHLGYEEQKIYVKRASVGMSKAVFSRGMLELIGYRVIYPVQHKRELYWVNLSIISCGQVQRTKKDV